MHEHHYGMYGIIIVCQPSVDYSIHECADAWIEARARL